MDSPRVRAKGWGGLLAAVLLLPPAVRPEESRNPASGAARSVPTFHRGVEDLLKKRCAGCHGGERPKGRFSVETWDAVLAGGKRGRAVVPGKPAESLLFQLVSGVRKAYMPPKNAEPLSEAEIELLRRWIEAGAPRGTPPEEAPVRTERFEVYPRPPLPAALLYTESHLVAAGYREVLVHSVAKVSAVIQGAESGIEGEGAGAGAAQTVPACLEPLWRIPVAAERLTAFVSLGGGRAAGAGGDPGRRGVVFVFDLETGELVASRQSGSDCVTALTALPGGRLAAGGTDGRVRILRAADLEETGALELHADWVLALASDPGGAYLFSAGRDGRLRAVRREGGDIIVTRTGFDPPPAYLFATRSGARGRLVAGFPSGRVLLFATPDLEESKVRLEIGGRATAFAADPAGERVAVAKEGGSVAVLRLDGGEKAEVIETTADWIYAMAWSPEGRRLALGGADGAIRIVGVGERKCLGAFYPVRLESQEKRR